MERNQIYNEVQKIESVNDFAHLLNKIKQDEFGTSKYKITEEQLYHFSNVKIVPNRYKKFQIRKKSGGLREINAPCYQLSIILHILNILLKSLYTPNSCVMGFTEGKSVVSNAMIHANHHYVFNIDLKDFFPSIPQGRVWARLKLPPFNFPQEIANVIAGLCCHYNEDGSLCVLPQGAATSPLLTNAVCDKLDKRMMGVARRFGVHYSRYADDMSFSSMHNVYQEGSEFRTEIKRIIEEQGFKMNENKTRLLRDGERQEVTGLTVNSIVNVSRKYISDLRWILSVWEREGYAKAYSLFYPKYKKEKGYIKKGEPIMENVIGGKLNYLRMVRGANNDACNKLFARYNKLQQLVYIDKETDKNKSYIWIQPYKMEDFKRLFETSLSLEVSNRKKLIAKCTLAGMDKTIAISKPTQQKMCPDIESREIGEKIESGLLEKCFVTLCQSRGKNFWIITEFEPKRSECLSIQNANINIDALLSIWEEEGLKEAVTAFNKYILKGEPIYERNVEDIPNIHFISKEDELRSINIPIEDSKSEIENLKATHKNFTPDEEAEVWLELNESQDEEIESFNTSELEEIKKNSREECTVSLWGDKEDDTNNEIDSSTNREENDSVNNKGKNTSR